MQRPTPRTILNLVACALLAAIFTATAQQNQDQVVLSMWDEFTEGPKQEAINQILDRCTEQYPNITIERQVMDLEQMRQVIRTAISSGEGPDIFYTATGYGGVGSLIDAGIIEPLTEQYERFGWSEGIYDWAEEFVTYKDDLWAVPYEAEVTGIFYHKDAFEAAGLAEPETWSDFTEALDTLQASGEYQAPIALGARQLWTIGWLESVMMGAGLTDEELRSIVFELEPWNTSDAVRTFSAINDLYQEGWIIDSATGLGYDEQTAAFYNGLTPVTVVGSWILPELAKDYPDADVGFFVTPRMEGVESARPVIGVGGAFHVVADSPHKEEVYQILDCLLEPQSGETWLSVSKLFSPLANIDVGQLDLTPLQEEVYAELQRDSAAYMFFNTVPEEVNTTTWNNIVSMWQGEMTPEEVAEQKQEVWSQAIEDGRAVPK